MQKDHFNKIFWFIVGICGFGGFLTIFLIIWLPIEEAKRIADTSLIFWLSTAVSGGIGYLLGSNATQAKKTETTIPSPDNDTKTTIIQEPQNTGK